MKDAYTKTPEQVLSDLHSDGSGGLTKEQAEQSRKKYGSNTFIRESHESLLKKIWDASTEPMLLMLIFAAVITLGVNIARYMTGGEYNFLECAGIFAAIALSVVITIVTEGKSAKAFEALNRINEDTLVKALRDNSPQLIPQKDIVVGDILLVETGDKLVADARLLESNDLSTDLLLQEKAFRQQRRQILSVPGPHLWQSAETCCIPAALYQAVQEKQW